MKKYIQPKIRAIELNEKQTVLQVCKTSGRYFIGTTQCAFMTHAAPATACPNSVKGVANMGYNTVEVQNMPS
ncbi:MAG: hypothetical protein PHQ52_03630 [Candidatus Omnitrophica bacterium]|nr:hypothetical protein [Candidatus Omnitrophota bacterium]